MTDDNAKSDVLHVREHGCHGSTVIALHGGPAGVGSAAPIARGLADAFHVLEPWQRGSEGDEPLTVARHIADLDAVIDAYCSDETPSLIGESWGAMLALAYAADHPDKVRSLVLVGCGTFDVVARTRMRAIIDERMDNTQRQQLERLAGEDGDFEEQLKRKYNVILTAFGYDTVPDTGDRVGPLDTKAHTQTWDDMLRLQAEGFYPAAFSSITSPVLMLHGDYDPHPGGMIAESLRPHIDHLEYHELSRCGHSPWRERHARDAFFTVLRTWLCNY